MNRRLFLYAGVAAAAAASGGYFLAERRNARPAQPAAAPAEGAGDPLAQLRQLALPDLQGTPRKLADWSGQPLVVNFWATWCAPCVKEMPELDALQKKYPRVRFVGIGVDTADNMRKFVEKIPVSYPMLVMGAGAIDTLRGLGNPSGGLPFTLLLSADGGMKRKILGQIVYDDLDRSVAGLSS